jgi:hypothetical protein
VVLSDWRRFLSEEGLTAQVATTDGFEGNFGADDLAEAWPGARLIRISNGGLGLNAVDPAAIFESVEAAPPGWVLLVKLDTLPYCEGPGPGYLAGLVRTLEAGKYWGATGSFIPCDLSRDAEGRAVTARYSNNYSLFRRDAWLGVMADRRPDFVEQIRSRRLTPASRFVTEATIESYLQESGERMLFLEDSTDRSVLHVNQWGDDLLRIRERYLRRQGVDPFLNRFATARREPWQYPAWQRYYGWPRPSRLRRARVWAGRTRRRLLDVLSGRS